MKLFEKLSRPHWILILLTPDGTRRLCPFDGVVCVSVVLLCWHRLPIWLPPLALRNSRHLFFHLVFVISRTATLQLHCSSGLRLRHHRLRLYRRQFQRYRPLAIGIIHVAKFKYEKLLNNAADPVDTAWLLASCSPWSGDRLHALPLSSVGSKMDNASVRIAAGLRLGAPVVRP